MAAKAKPKDRDFLNHLETYLAKRDGVDKLLKISRYATKIVLASSLIPETKPIVPRLKSFESSVGVSRKAFRLGKFVQDINALRSSRWDSNRELVLILIAYGGEGLYYFVEQFIWLAKSGLIDAKHSKWLQKISAWAELVGYVGSVSMKVRDLRKLREEETCVASTIEISVSRGMACDGEDEKMKKIKEKKTLKVLSIMQDVADGLMTISDIGDGKGVLSAPSVVSSAGLFSAIVSTHKNWVSC
ncbi:PREDICTED: peroxisomal membrane protein 11A [Camelina sativa]|uniref:Peroxisomal membrane protein 11A n=1 Tax=Camelina sativa TaxID=90675 RepID=A0ABM0X1D3_CAMSA|nr:PREDICTED: peroxisomal membrane protein 11A [Camelina sativa]